MSDSLLAQLFIAQTPLKFDKITIAKPSYRKNFEELSTKHQGILNVLWRMQTVLGRPVSANELSKALGTTPASAGGRMSAVSSSLKYTPTLCNYQLVIEDTKPKRYLLVRQAIAVEHPEYDALIWESLQKLSGIIPTDETRITALAMKDKTPALDLLMG